MTRDVRVHIEVSPARESTWFERHREPVTLGIAFARGQARGMGWQLLDSGGVSVPLQVCELDRWSDGSTRWLLVDFLADIPAGRSARYELTFVPESDDASSNNEPWVFDAGDSITLATGTMDFTVPRSGRLIVTGVPRGRTERHTVSAVLTDLDYGEHFLEISRTAIARTGPIRAEITVEGRLQIGAEKHVDVAARLHFFAGLGAVRVELSLTNPRSAAHSGGLWDLGDPGSLLFRDVSLACETGSPMTSAWVSIDRAAPLTAVKAPVEIYQDSSGGESWRSENHQNRHRDIPLTFRGYRVSTDGSTANGYRATPILVARTGESQVAYCALRFWEEFPKAVEVDGRGLAIRLFPRQFSDLHELQGGERKTHTFWLGFGPDSVTETPFAWVRSPALAVASGDTYEAAGVWRPLKAGSTRSQANYGAFIEAAIEGEHSFEKKREIIDEFGWRHFGDLYADHEAVNQPALVSHYNNQYDAIAGFATRFCATGDRRWWTAMDELAAHVTDVDIYHTDEDRSAYNHGLFWHTSHYEPAHTATHRSYSRLGAGGSGGPSNEHNYTTGLMLHYFLTGCARSRDAVLELAGWVLDMDDGAKGRFWWIAGDETGLASATREPDYHGPGRGAAYSINALLDAHRLTGAPKYLSKAERLVERCVQPGDDPAAMGLLDAERRWSYTVFLQVLGKYLEYRAERGLLDGHFAYGRAVLLRYASWMATEERPYLDHRDQLEYPTETWPAQDIRKSAVLEFAARCASDPVDVSRFTKAAERFFNDAIVTLSEMPTRILTRPIVLLLAYGFQRPLEDQDLSVALAVPIPLTGSGRFVSYRRRVLTRLAAAAAALIGALAVLAWRLWTL